MSSSAYTGPRCPGVHASPPCPDPKCELKSRIFSDNVRRRLAENERKRRAEEERRRVGPAFGHEVETDE